MNIFKIPREIYEFILVSVIALALYLTLAEPLLTSYLTYPLGAWGLIYRAIAMGVSIGLLILFVMFAKGRLIK